MDIPSKSFHLGVLDLSRFEGLDGRMKRIHDCALLSPFGKPRSAVVRVCHAGPEEIGDSSCGACILPTAGEFLTSSGNWELVLLSALSPDMWTDAQQQKAEASFITHQARRPNQIPRRCSGSDSGAGIRARLGGNGDSLRKGLATVQQSDKGVMNHCWMASPAWQAPLLSRIDTLQTDARTVVGIPIGFSWQS